MLALLTFIVLHIIGARYVYSNVPYDEWTMAWFGHSMSESFHFRRNHYDRLVHFAYGLLATPPQTEILQRRLRFTPLGTHLLSLALVICVGSLYEIFEWGLAELMAPEFADRYNGQQGDPWDSQKDMTLNALGALFASCSIWLLQRFRSPVMPP